MSARCWVAGHVWRDRRVYGGCVGWTTQGYVCARCGKTRSLRPAGGVR